MSQYPTYKLGDVADILDSFRKPINSTERTKRIQGKKENELYPYYGATGQVGLIDEYLTDGEYVLVGEDGAPFLEPFKNKSYIIRGKAWVNNHAHIISGKKGVSCNQYLNYYLNSFDYRDYVNGTTRLKLTQGNLVEIPIPLPPLPTQRLIVSRIETLFAELDKAEERLRTAQQQLKTYRQAVLNHWLTNGSKRWKKVTIGDIVEKVEYGSSAKSQKTGRVPVLRMGNIQNGRFDWSDLVYSDDDEEIKKYLLKKDDVLFNRTNSPELVGKTAIYKCEHPAIFAGYLIRLHRKEDLINADFLNYYLNSDIAKNYGNIVKSDGVNQSNINGQKLKTYPLFLPSLSEQQRIVEEIETRLSQAEAAEVRIAEALQKTESLRQSILKKAFGGELV